MSNTDSNSQPFVAKIDTQLANKLRIDLAQQGFEFSTPEYTVFAAKKKGVTCVLYQTGKLVVQGKGRAEFIEFYLEPEILKTFTFTHPLSEMDDSARIGIDESGKGDFFGPLCIAGVYAQGSDIEKLHDLGVRDSKGINDASIYKIAEKIKTNFTHHIVKINPSKYNQIYLDFKNLNKLLAWGHATTIELLVNKSGCSRVIIDQFADESVVLTALKRKKLELQLTQRHRAEEDLVVAAASILARHAFLEGLDKLSKEIGIKLPKGASASTIQTGREIFRKYGTQGLMSVCKQHFKTFALIVQNA